MKKQVDKSHYKFDRYLDKRRWASVWHQLNEVLRCEPSHVLEIGPGPGVFKAMLLSLGVPTQTLDIDTELLPDCVSSIFRMPFRIGAFDVVCAFQVLEHLPYPDALKAFREMARVAERCLVISLPDARPVWINRIQLPKLGAKEFLVPRPFWRPVEHVFDGQHYWEINKKDFDLRKVAQDFSLPGWGLERSYRVWYQPYHRFFIYKKRIGD